RDLKILILTNRVPFPPNSGYPIVVYNTIKGLLQLGLEITLFSINTNKHRVDVDDIYDPVFDSIKFHSFSLDTEVNVWGALFNVFSNQSYNVSRYFDDEAAKLLEDILRENEFDIIQLEGLFLLPYLLSVRKFSKAKIVLRAHNIEHLIWERNSKMAKPGAKKWYLQSLAARMKEFEIYNLNSCDALVPISNIDAAKFVELGCKLPIHTTPVGMSLNGIAESGIGIEPSSLCYIGSMDWLPNREGIEWFLEVVWPKVLASFPDTKFFLAGRNFPDDFPGHSYPNVEIVGEVENSHSFLRSKSMLIVPLFSGSGVRVKIIEAMAEGRPVVSTTVGAEGMNATDNVNILIADTPDAFARQIKRLLKDQEEANRIGENAKGFIAENFDNKKIIQDLLDFYKSILK
ncbi:MAG: glycosyltransferase family 4 protein, partial [Chitinophagales bacterium]